jgi:transposase
MSQTLNAAIAVVGIDIGKNSFHIVGHDERGAIVLRQKWSRGQVEARFANVPPCLIGMEACVGAHHLSRKLRALGHDARLNWKAARATFAAACSTTSAKSPGSRDGREPWARSRTASPPTKSRCYGTAKPIGWIPPMDASKPCAAC